MRLVHLLDIEETFLIKGRGVFVRPDLPCSDLRSSGFRTSARVERLDGSSTVLDALFICHFITLIGGDIKRVTTLIFPRASKEDVPVGSHVLVEEDTLALL